MTTVPVGSDQGSLSSLSRGSRIAVVVLLGGILMSALLDIPQKFTIGSVSASGAASVALLGLTTLLVVAEPRLPTSTLSSIFPLGVFAAWISVSVLLNPIQHIQGLQTIAMVWLLLFTIVLAGREGSLVPTVRDRLGVWLTRGVLIASGLYILTAMQFGMGALRGFVGARGYALLALMGLAWTLARWRAGSRIALVVSGFILLVIAASLSRLGLVVAIGLVGISLLRPNSLRSQIRTFVAIVAGLFAIYALVTYFDPLNERFFEGDVSLTLGGVEINGQGRDRMWGATIDSAQRSLWFGHGAGSATKVIERLNGLQHPHNDYLRVLHDWGLIGLGFWAWALLRLLRGAWSSWKYAPSRQDAVPHQAAFLAVLAFGAAMVTDNLMTYPFIVVPLGILVGGGTLEPVGRYSTRVAGEAPHLDQLATSARSFAR